MTTKPPDRFTLLVAEQFLALSQPVRISLLSVLNDGENTVGALARKTGISRGCVSRHLLLLHALGILNRRKVGTAVHYSIAEPAITEMCQLGLGFGDAAIEPGTETRRRKPLGGETIRKIGEATIRGTKDARGFPLGSTAQDRGNHQLSLVFPPGRHPSCWNG